MVEKSTIQDYLSSKFNSGDFKLDTILGIYEELSEMNRLKRIELEIVAKRIGDSKKFFEKTGISMKDIIIPFGDSPDDPRNLE